MELFNEPIIQKKTLSDVIKNDNIITNSTMVGGSFNGGKITIGSGENLFTANKDGIFLGSSSFNTAPFSVNMLGDVIANSITITGGSLDGTSTIGGRLCSTVAEAIDANGHFIDDRFDTDSKTILSDFTFGTSGALQIGTYSDGVSGDIRISPNGILGRNKDGDTTFSINGTTGEATFGGTLVAASGTFGTVTAGILSGVEISGSTITGGTIQTASSGQRVVISGSNNALTFYNSNNFPTVSLANADGTAVYILSDSVSSTGITISSASSGNGIYCSNAANVAYRGIYVEQTNTGDSNTSPCVELQHDGRYYAQLIETTNQSGGILCQTFGTGKSVVINNSGNETCLEINETSGSTNSASSNIRISSNSAGSAIAISKGAVSGNVTGIKMSLSGGLPAAFEFAGSELVVGAVGGLQTRKVRVRIGTDLYYIPLYTE
ncbi:hypothetical protein [Methanoculleus sp.]|uniref:hypothetical protein n=1 Tax=Methanoculleus sp. TaxID=90427 RepID=UPI0025CE6457|nr:hypothetical protein [Methanoculleus sp.]MCK9320140.1 hypothetical protein [Methanoculleus sp.]